MCHTIDHTDDNHERDGSLPSYSQSHSSSPRLRRPPFHNRQHLRCKRIISNNDAITRTRIRKRQTSTRRRIRPYDCCEKYSTSVAAIVTIIVWMTLNTGKNNSNCNFYYATTAIQQLQQLYMIPPVFSLFIVQAQVMQHQQQQHSPNPNGGGMSHTVDAASSASVTTTSTSSTSTATSTPKIRISSTTTTTANTKMSPIPSPMIATVFLDSDSGASTNNAGTVKQPAQPTSKLSAFTAPIPMAYIKGGGSRMASSSSTLLSTSTTHTTDEGTETSIPPNKQSQNRAFTASHSNLPPSLQQQLEEQEFLQWCDDVLNISTSMVQIQHFPYHRSSIIATMHHRQRYMNNNDIEYNIFEKNDDDDDDSYNDDIANTVDATNDKMNDENSNNDIVWIRGLAAAQDIVKDDIILQIPAQSLFSVATIIDDDPILSKMLGPEARNKYGWNDDIDIPYSSSTDENTMNDHYNSSSYQMYEIPLLTIALLYHRSIGSESSIYHYIKILQKSPVDHLPYTWNEQQWHEHTTARRLWSFDTVWNVAKEIRHEIKYMYKHVVLKILMKEHPEIFGRNVVLDPFTNEWMYSFQMFQWAYAIVNSRHWQLPKDTIIASSSPIVSSNISYVVPVPDQDSLPSNTQHPQHQLQQEGLDQVPPADTPTESWVLDRGDVDDDKNDDTVKQNGMNELPNNRRRHKNEAATVDHSFLAPVADLLNFGPPCTRVKYNYETHTFDTIATCDFVQGQEITFWYSNECSDVMMGIYGFTHSLISPCPTNDELLYRTKVLEQTLHDAYTDMKILEDDLEYVEKILDDCDCCDISALSETGGEERDPTISTMALHEEKNNGNPHLRHLDDTSNDHDNNNSRDSSRSRQGHRTTTTTSDENHLLVRRTRRWSSPTSEF